jgi:hypothetical protein
LIFGVQATPGLDYLLCENSWKKKSCSLPSHNT